MKIESPPNEIRSKSWLTKICLQFHKVQGQSLQRRAQRLEDVPQEVGGISLPNNQILYKIKANTYLEPFWKAHLLKKILIYNIGLARSSDKI